MDFLFARSCRASATMSDSILQNSGGRTFKQALLKGFLIFTHRRRVSQLGWLR